MDGDSHGGVFVLHEKRERLDAHDETSHTDHGLTFLVDGWFRIEHGQTITAKAGSLTIVPAGVPHRALEGENVEFGLVGFCSSCLALDESQLLMSSFRRVRHGALPVVDIAEARRARLTQLFRDLQTESTRGAPESAELSRALLLLILGEVRRALPGGEEKAADGSLVSSALEFIQRRCFDPISLRDVAAAVHLSPAHVATTLKKQTGFSVGEWISAGRVSEAASRLTHTDDSLDDIAEHVGWADTTHFIRQFKKARGMTPAAWRRQARSKHRSH